MVTRTPIIIEENDDSLLDKVMGNQIDKLRAKDGIEAANLVTGLLPGGQLIGVPLSGLQGALSADDEKAKYEKTFGSSLARMSHRGYGVKRRLAELENRWKNSTGEAAVSGMGAFAGAALTGLLAVSGPVGWALGFGGMMAGGYVGSKVYNTAFNKQVQDPLILGKQIDKMQRRGEYVPPELVFATLAANLQDQMGKNVDDLLEASTGKRLFHQAISDPRGIERIGLLMKNRRIDRYIRANTLVPFDAHAPNKSVSEQLAELINTRRIRATEILNPSVALITAIAANNSQPSPMYQSRYQSPTYAMNPLAPMPGGAHQTSRSLT